MLLLVGREDQRGRSLPVDNILPYGVEVGLARLDGYAIYRVNDIGHGDAEAIRANPNDIAVLLVQPEIGVVRVSSPDHDEAVQVGEFGQPGARNAAMLLPSEDLVDGSAEEEDEEDGRGRQQETVDERREGVGQHCCDCPRRTVLGEVLSCNLTYLTSYF